MSRRRQKLRQQAYWSNQPGLFDLVPDDDGSATIEPPGDIEDGCEKLRYISFGSGSSGNCAYVGTPSCGLLIDAGVDNNYVTAQLAANSIDRATIRGILLTHDHSDHVRYAYAILRYNKHMRLYATPKALNGLLRRHSISRRISDYHQPIYKEFPFNVGPLTVTAFETSHDGSDNVGFAIDLGDIHFVVTTDTGVITPRSDHYMRRAQYLMIESDYDAEMLHKGPYPAHLKARIAGPTGHLDNADTGRYIASLAADGMLRRVFLCHLSDINNSPSVALHTVHAILEEAGLTFNRDLQPRSADTRLHVAVLPRKEASPLVTLG